MKNMLGEEVGDKSLRLEWIEAKDGYPRWHLWVFKGKNYLGYVAPNGWNGYSLTIGYLLGEPMLNNLMENTLAFSEMKAIMDEYVLRVTPRELLDGCIKALAREKKISIDSAICYIAEKKIQCISI